MTAYEKIKKLADERGLTIKSIEKEAGLGNGTIAKWQVCAPTVSNLKKVAEALKVNIEVLI